MWMAWGPELTFFCNDAYRRDTLGKKYPWALGRAAREVWAEIWPDIGPRIETVLRDRRGDLGRGAAAVPRAQRLRRGDLPHVLLQPADRRRRAIAGMLCVVSEETERVIGERRLATLRDLGSGATDARPRTRSSPPSTAASRRNRARPAVRARLPLRRRRTARGAPAIRAGARVAPPCGRAAWRELRRRWRARPGLPTGAWDEPPLAGAGCPLADAGPGRAVRRSWSPALNRYRPLDDDYRGVPRARARARSRPAIASARAYEAERRAPRRWPSSTAPRPRSSPTSATSCARR